ncbi:MAG: hypothetical protein HKN73_15795, partial [Gemmatimonadetes bacterium]|nr:hypothetical protein [Gemmatimonadota bacterium]
MSLRERLKGGRPEEAAARAGEHSEGPAPRINTTAVAGLLGFVLGLGALGLFAAIPLKAGDPGPAAEDDDPSAATVAHEPGAYDPWDLTEGFSAVAEQTIPGVVRIETTRVANAPTTLSNLPPG